VSCICFCSKQDIAAQSIKQKLLELHPFQETEERFDDHPVYRLGHLSLVTINSDSIHADRLDQQFPEASLFIFASRHKSAAFKPALLVHTPGNWSEENPLGGKPSTLCTSHPSAIKTALLTLLAERQRLSLTSWACGLEATHHGPWIVNTPVLFVEIGSTEQEWRNEVAAEAVANAIVTASKSLNQEHPVILCFGGPHYCPTFTRITAETPYAPSHILPKYHMNLVSESLIRQAIASTAGTVKYAVLDWKGMSGPQRTLLRQTLDRIGLETKRARDLIRGEQKLE